VPLWIGVAAGALRKCFSPGVKGYRNRSFARIEVRAFDLAAQRGARVLLTRKNIGMLAASANTSDYAVDVRIFLIKDPLRSRRRCRKVGSARLVVTYRR
jgi:hypothetical protein